MAPRAHERRAGSEPGQHLARDSASSESRSAARRGLASLRVTSSCRYAYRRPKRGSSSGAAHSASTMRSIPTSPRRSAAKASAGGAGDSAALGRQRECLLVGDVQPAQGVVRVGAASDRRLDRGTQARVEEGERSR